MRLNDKITRSTSNILKTNIIKVLNTASLELKYFIRSIYAASLVTNDTLITDTSW